jgi:hypothetical protein
MPLIRSAAFGLIAFLLLSCAPKQALMLGPAVPYEGQVTVDALRKSIVFDSMKAVRSEVKARIFKGGKKLGSFKGVFLYRYPGFTRLRAFDLFGAPVMDMVLASGTMQVYFPGSDVLYKGRAPALGAPEDAGYSVGFEDEMYVLYSEEPSRNRRVFYFDPVTLRNTGMTVYMDGNKFITADFARFSGPAPMAIRLSFINGFKVEMELREPEVNGKVPLELFGPIGRGGTTVLPLGRLMRKAQGD